MFLKCQEIVDKLALFSSNEEKDDISTGDLKYLLVCSQLHRNFLASFCCCKVVLSSFMYQFFVFRQSSVFQLALCITFYSKSC